MTMKRKDEIDKEIEEEEEEEEINKEEEIFFLALSSSAYHLIPLCNYTVKNRSNRIDYLWAHEVISQLFCQAWYPCRKLYITQLFSIAERPFY